MGKKPYKLILGECPEALKDIEDNTVDSIVTDPPAGISFMSKSWDADKGGRMEWIAWMEKIAAECIRVIKPGGHALVWAIPRTSHWTGMAWENAGWVPRDKIYHCFGSGFPKAHNIGAAVDKLQGNERKVVGYKRHDYPDLDTWGTAKEKQKGKGIWDKKGGGELLSKIPVIKGNSEWEGWHTALKPAIEEWWLFRKPLIGTVAENVLEHGTGGLNIGACRISTNGDIENARGNKGNKKPKERESQVIATKDGVAWDGAQGRYPANLILTPDEEVLACFPETTSGNLNAGHKRGETSVNYTTGGGIVYRGYGGDSGSAARFFKQCPYTNEDFDDAKRLIYCGKATKRDRDEGCEGLEVKEGGAIHQGGEIPRLSGDGKPIAIPKVRNVHPCVKSTSLMRYLCKLITPPGGTVLDPFMGSGSTGKAAVKEGFGFIGIELEAEYLEIANARIRHAYKHRGFCL